MYKKSGKVEVERRVDQCLTWMIEGWSAFRIVQYIAANEKLADGHEKKRADLVWSVSERQIYQYCSKAEKRLISLNTSKREQEYSKSIMRYNDLYRRAYLREDFRACRLIQNELDQLHRVREFGIGGDDKPKDRPGIKLPNGDILNLD